MALRPVMLAHLVYEVLAAIDSGKYQDIGVAEAKAHMRDGDLVQWLSARVPEADLGLFNAESGRHGVHLVETVREDRDAINDAFRQFVRYHGGHEAERWGISRSGLCLIAAWGTRMLYHDIREAG